MVELTTKILGAAADVIAPDGCAVRLLAAGPRGSMAHFTLLPGQVSRAVAHRTVEELWYFLAGSGRMWRRLGEREETIAVAAGVSIAIPTGAQFQLRNDGRGATRRRRGHDAALAGGRRGLFRRGAVAAAGGLTRSILAARRRDRLAGEALVDLDQAASSIAPRPWAAAIMTT